MNLINKIKFLLKRPKIVIVTGEGRACAKKAIFQVLKQYFKIFLNKNKMFNEKNY